MYIPKWKTFLQQISFGTNNTIWRKLTFDFYHTGFHFLLFLISGKLWKNQKESLVILGNVAKEGMDFASEKLEMIKTEEIIDGNSFATRINENEFDKHFQCSLCEKKFKKQSCMKRHFETHEDIKLYKCDICGKQSKNSWLLRVHKRSHADVKHFKCEVCGKGFARSGTLKLHSNIHTREKIFECTTCLKTFN